jgi:uncharacterized membrane protein YkvA (DUF1232 family)
LSASSIEDRVTIELNPKERRLYDRLRERVSEPGVQQTGLMDLLLLVPDLTVLLMRLLRDERVPVGSKGIALLGIGYVLSPLDILPEILLGPIGFVDDLLILGTALSRMMNRVHPDVVRSHWPGRQDALETIQRVTTWTEDQLQGGLRRTLGRWFGGDVR